MGGQAERTGSKLDQSRLFLIDADVTHTDSKERTGVIPALPGAVSRISCFLVNKVSAIRFMVARVWQGNGVAHRRRLRIALHERSVSSAARPVLNIPFLYSP